MVSALASEALSANGSIVVIEGLAGIGKTALLEAAREATADLNVQIAHARASELDRSYVFGIVRPARERSSSILHRRAIGPAPEVSRPSARLSLPPGKPPTPANGTRGETKT